MMRLNLGRSWVCTAVPRLAGTVLFPAKNDIERFRRTNLPFAQNMIFDPQLYLCGTDPKANPKLCAGLATYPWFDVNVTAYDSDQSGRRDWLARIQEKIATKWPSAAPSQDRIPVCALNAVEFQVGLGFSRIVLPSPLVTEREGEALSQVEWLEAGLSAVSEVEPGQPVLFTVAVAESALSDSAFEPNGLLDQVVDQVSSRVGIYGVYIIVAQTYCSHPFATSPAVLRAYAHLAARFRTAGVQEIICNFCDAFGLVCIGLGADSFCTGPTQSVRRLCLAGREGGGPAPPNYFSLPALGDFRTERDLNEVVKAGLFGTIAHKTRYSAALIERIESGGTAADVPAWAESLNNTGMAQQHLLAALATRASSLSALPKRGRVRRLRTWLNAAIQKRNRIAKATSSECKPQYPDARVWLQVLDLYASAE